LKIKDPFIRDAYDIPLPTNDEGASNSNKVQKNTEDIHEIYQEMESFTPQLREYHSKKFNDEVNLKRDDAKTMEKMPFWSTEVWYNNFRDLLFYINIF